MIVVAVFEIHIHRVGTAALDLAAIVAVGALKAHYGDITLFSLATFHRHHRGQLPAGLLQHLVHLGGVEGHGFRFRLQPLGALELW